LPGHELVLDLVSRGDAVLIDTPERLALLVKRRGWGTVSPQSSEFYFRRDHIASLAAVFAECRSIPAGGGL
jgi:hypothetical protein